MRLMPWTIQQLGLLVAAGSFLLSPSTNGVANLENVNIRKAFVDADAVYQVHIIDDKKLFEGGALCGTRYRGKVQREFKGMPGRAGDEITFGRYPRLVPGNNYVLFMSYLRDPQAVFESEHGSADIGDHERKYLDF